MVGVVIVAHGKLAQAFKDALELIMGPQDNFEAISIDAHNRVDALREMLKNAIERVDNGKGVLILTDMFGGTPSNISLSFLEEKEIEVLSGVNLPMLLKLANLRMESANLEVLKEELCTTGREKILVASDLLNQRLIQKSGKSK